MSQTDLDFFKGAHAKLKNEFSFKSSNGKIQRIQDLKELEAEILSRLEKNVKIKFKNLQLSEYFAKWMTEEALRMTEDELPF